MASFDLVLRGAEVIDGTGTPRRRADLGVRDGRIAALGAIGRGEGAREIDLDGRVLAPGFVDIHTHFDAQIFWDPALTPASLHGVTSVAGGNCGFTIAPLTPEAGPYLMRMLARVEGMPLEALETGVPWNWRSFDEYLDRIEGRLGINAGFLVGHSTLRRVVMGDAATEREAMPAEIDSMARLLHESLAAGGLGFSSSLAPTHNDAEGRPVPSRHASRDELVRLASCLRDHEGTSLEFIPTVGMFDDSTIELMIDMALGAERPLNWNVLGISATSRRTMDNQLMASDRAAARGARILALALPQQMTMRLNLESGFIFDALPGFAEIIALPLAERCRRLGDPAVRADLDRRGNSPEAGLFRIFANWGGFRIAEAFSESTLPWRGHTVAEVAESRGISALDAFFDLAIADGLRTSFIPPLPGDDDETWRLRAEMWQDPRVVVGASDAGAHLDMIDTFAATTSLLGPAVRERELLPLETAVRLITDIPARLYGLRQRGRIECGWHADLVAFDPATVGPGPVHTRRDLPQGAARLYAEANGIAHVFVNGVETVRGRELTGDLPGRVLRSGRDTGPSGC